jgi:hypothetical protein
MDVPNVQHVLMDNTDLIVPGKMQEHALTSQQRQKANGVGVVVEEAKDKW